MEGKYDYVEYILEAMKENIALAQSGEMKDFKFHHYLLMHMILYKNVGYISPNFIDHTLDANGEIPI